jgi:hypothetical protein
VEQNKASAIVVEFDIPRRKEKWAVEGGVHEVVVGTVVHQAGHRTAGFGNRKMAVEDMSPIGFLEVA